MCQNSFLNPPNRPNISTHCKSTLSLNPNPLLLSCAGLCFAVKSLFNGMDMGNTDGSTKTEMPRLEVVGLLGRCHQRGSWKATTGFLLPLFSVCQSSQSDRKNSPPPRLSLEETSSCSSVGTACLHLSSKEITQPGLDSPTDKAKSSVEPRLKSFL